MCGVPGSRVDFERRGRGNKGFPVSSCKPCKIDYLGISGAETVAFFEYKFRSNEAVDGLQPQKGKWKTGLREKKKKKKKKKKGKITNNVILKTK